MNSSESSPNSPERTIVLVDQSQDAKDAARLAAERRLTEELNSGGRIKRAFNRFWKDRMWSEYYIQKYERQAQERIDASGDALALDADADSRQRATMAIIDRFQSDEDSVIHENAGEKRTIVGPESELSNEIKDLIRRNVIGEIDDNALNEETGRVLVAFASNSEEYAGLFEEGKARTMNMTDNARGIKAAIEHGESLEDALSGLKVVIGEARNSVRTEVNYTRVDRIVEKMQKTKLRCLVNPEVLATGAAIAAGITRFGGQRLTAAICTFAPGLATGVWAALRENKRVKDERRQHVREMALGGQIEDSSRRREDMEETRYDTVTAQSLIDGLNTHFKADDALESDAAVMAALAALTEAQARNSASDEKRADLISYSDASRVGEERFALDLAIAQAKTIAEHRLDQETMARLGIDTNANIKDYINQAADLYIESTIEQDIEAKDRVFSKLKAKRVALAGVAAGVATIASGLITQEIIAGIDTSRAGLIDDLTGQKTTLMNGERHQTLLNSFIHGEQMAQHVAPASNYSPVNNMLEVSADHAVNVSNGELQFIDAQGNITLDHIPVNPDGTLPTASVDMLRQHGMTVDEIMVQTGVKQIPRMGTIEEYLKLNNATHVKRDFWYDNNTKVFDKNELKLWYGGVDDTGVDANGHYAYSVSHMTQGGSTHGQSAAHWNELLGQGKLKMALSASRGTQSDVLLVGFKPDGTLDIDPQSPAAQLFEVRNGQAVFKGGYMEVVEDNGFSDGHEHIRPLATVVGENSVKGIPGFDEEPVFEKHFKITTAGYDVPGTFTEAAPGVPLTTRRPLENLAKRYREGMGDYYYSGHVSEEEATKIRREISPRLSDNPDARLNLGQEAEWFRGQLEQREGAGYIASLDDQIASSPELSSIDPQIETLITIPVAAAYESENIYKTLSLYGQQDKESLQKSLVIMNLNWLDAAESDPSTMERVQMTIAEIERARKDFPDLKIAVVTNTYDAAKVKKTGGPIGYVARDLTNVTLLALQRNIAEGNISNSQDVTIIRHDADMQGMSRHHLRQFQESAKRHPLADFLKGVTRYGVRAAEKYPGYSIITSFSSAIAFEGVNKGVVHSGGANYGVRAATLASLGGLGELPNWGADGGVWSGAGSDDLYLGSRIEVARMLGQGFRGYGSRGTEAVLSVAERAKQYVSPVVGANIDTNPDRLLAAHLGGQWFQRAWDSFSDGGGGYKLRTADAEVMTSRVVEESAKPDGELYDMIDKSITMEIRTSGEEISKRVLGLYFGSQPGLYRIIYHVEGGRKIPDFQLTKKGRKWLKNRIERESDGRYGPYGARKMRQLYGIATGRRKPVAKESPLVSPVNA